MKQLYPIKGAIQDYAWGGIVFIPELLNIDNTSQKKYAELWMGTHNRGTAILEDDAQNRSLKDLITENPRLVLGEKVIAQFGEELPFLFKVLAVRKMLSIQVHPSKAAAVKGFKKENETGIPLTAFHRNYKDDNHKPEVMVALTDFWLLHGFKSIEAIEKIFVDVPELEPLKKHFSKQSIFQLYKTVMEMPQEAIDVLLKPLEVRLSAALNRGELNFSQADYWAALAFKDYTRDGHYDRGIFSIYFFNLVGLKKGQGIFQDAGIPHAYLEGVNMELMANSDNVFRGGLTPKYVDVPELLEHIVFEPIVPQILEGQQISPLEKVYETPAPDFELSSIKMTSSQNYISSMTDTPEILIVLEGEVEVSNKKAVFSRKKGEIFFVRAGSIYQMSTNTETTLFKAKVA